jgi:hypothetical protein
VLSLVAPAIKFGPPTLAMLLLIPLDGIDV